MVGILLIFKKEIAHLALLLWIFKMVAKNEMDKGFLMRNICNICHLLKYCNFSLHILLIIYTWILLYSSVS